MNRILPIALVMLTCVSAGCDRSGKQIPSVAETTASTDAGTTLTDVAVQLNWYPESEHGGLYQALADGTFDSSGFRVEIRPGGRATPVAPELILGRTQFAIANADDVVLFRNQGADIVAVLAAMQDHPRCILVRADSGIDSFEDLAGKTLQRQAGRPFLEFMRAKGLLDNVQEVPYHGSVASLVSDKNVAIQAYAFAEPLLAQQQGVEVKTLMLSDLGWNPYSSVLITTGNLIREKPELVRQFVQATRQGWKNYISDGTRGNEKILAANEHGMTQEALKFGADGLRQLAVPDGTELDQVGQMSTERWNELVQQMAELKLADPNKVRPEDCFTVEFLE